MFALFAMGPGWDGERVGRLTLSQIHGILPYLRTAFAQVTEPMDRADRLARAEAGIVNVAGEPNPTAEHIAKVAERM